MTCFMSLQQYTRTKVVQAIKQTICNPEMEYNVAIESQCHNVNKNVRRIVLRDDLLLQEKR